MSSSRRGSSSSTATRGEVLFELAIGKDGNVVCSEPAKQVYLITWTSRPDNRLATVCVERSNTSAPFKCEVKCSYEIIADM